MPASKASLAASKITCIKKKCNSINAGNGDNLAADNTYQAK